jgi:hypothetical protein
LTLSPRAAQRGIRSRSSAGSGVPIIIIIASFGSAFNTVLDPSPVPELSVPAPGRNLPLLARPHIVLTPQIRTLQRSNLGDR